MLNARHAHRYYLAVVEISLQNFPICFCLEIEAKYEKKMRALREELELRRKTEIHEIEEVFFSIFFHC